MTGLQRREEGKAAVIIAIAVVVVVILAAIGFAVRSGRGGEAVDNGGTGNQEVVDTVPATDGQPAGEADRKPSTETATSESGGSPEDSTSPTTVTVNYTADGYDPAEITVAKGDTVKFTNNSSRQMWPASDEHPTHTIYSEFDPKDAVAKGASWSFTFDKTGTWKYHDHIMSDKTGTITVQ